MMKFKKTIKACRHDEDVPFRIMLKFNRAPCDCSDYDNGKCKFDNKKCKVVTYIREDKA